MSALKAKWTVSRQRVVRPGYLDTFVVIKFDNKHRAVLYDLELTIRQHGWVKDRCFLIYIHTTPSFLYRKNKYDMSCARYTTCYRIILTTVYVCEILMIYSFAGGLLSYFRNLLGSREMRILILGLDGAGKTTILYRFAWQSYLSDKLSFVFMWCMSITKSFWHGLSLYPKAIRD